LTFVFFCITFEYMKDKVMTIRLEKETQDKLKEMAGKDGRSVSNYVRFILDKIVKGELKL